VRQSLAVETVDQLPNRRLPANAQLPSPIHQSAGVLRDIAALLPPFVLLTVQAARILTTGTIFLTTDPTNPAYGQGDRYCYVNMALPNGNYKLAHTPPFLYRILVPLMVHGLYLLGVPFRTGFFTVTTLSVSISTVAIYYLVRGCHLSRFEAACAAIAYVLLHWAVAFVFYDYFLIDAASQMFVVVILLAVQRRQFTAAIVLATIGVVASERTFFGIAVGCVQLIWPYIGTTLSARTFFARVRSVPLGAWLHLAGLVILPVLAFQIVHHVQHPYYNTQLLTEIAEYAMSHFRYGYNFASINYDLNGATIFTYGALFFVATWALLLGAWRRTQFFALSYTIGLAVILYSFLLSADLQRLSILGWPFIIICAAAGLREIAERLRISVIWLWGMTLLAVGIFQASLTLQVIPSDYQQYLTTYGFHTSAVLILLLAALAIVAVWRVPVPRLALAAPSAQPAGVATDETPLDIQRTERLAALQPAAPRMLPADNDGIFWLGVQGGLAALNARCRWLATARLHDLATQTLMPLALYAQQTPMPPSARYMQAARMQWQRVMDRRQPRGDDVAALWQAYRVLIADYRMLRAQLRLAPTAMPGLETTVAALLATGPASTSDDSTTVITWQTLSIVLPAYNEEAVIAQTVQDCLRAVRHFCPNAEVIVVDDGSKDRTGAIIDELAARDARVIAVHNRPNQGYGGALLAGFAAARGRLLFFMDSDGQFDIQQIADLLKCEVEHPGAAIIGYRARRRDPLFRRLNAAGWKRLVRLMLGLRGIRDIDCAFKLFPTRLIRAAQVAAEGAMVNTEFLVKWQRMHVPIIQVPVRHFARTHGSATGANPRVILKAFQELTRLRLRLHQWQPPAEK
jgi:hypothetical protein